MNVQLLTSEQAAEYIGMSVHYLRNDRHRGTTGNRTAGPPFVRYGRRTVRYKQEDLDAWLAAQRVERHPQGVTRGRKRAG